MHLKHIKVDFILLEAFFYVLKHAGANSAEKYIDWVFNNQVQYS
jgi:hypothetical protein